MSDIISEADLTQFIDIERIGSLGVSVRRELGNDPEKKDEILGKINKIIEGFTADISKSADRRNPLGKFSEAKTDDELAGIGRNRTAEILKAAQTLRVGIDDPAEALKLDKVILTLSLTLEAFDLTTMFDKRAAALQFGNIRP
jgi:hypothetical protein